MRISNINRLSKAIIMVDTSSITITNFENLHQSAIEIRGMEIDVLIARLNDKIAGRNITSFQSLK
jgi:hypothetical protein